MAFTADRLLEGVKRRVTVPANQSLLSDDDILEFADDAILSKLSPLMVAANQDYFVRRQVQALTSGTDAYALPPRCIASSLRDLKLTDSSGATRDLALIKIEDIHMFTTGTIPHSFYFRDDVVVLLPSPTTTGMSLEFWIEIRCGRLVKTTSAMLVTAVAAPMVTVSSVPTGFTTGSVVDFVKATGAGRYLGIDATITNIAATTITFGANVVPSDLAVGDYISLQETSPIIQLPNECYPLLETETCKAVLGAVSDYDGRKVLDADAKDEEKNLKILIEPRVRGETTKIINRRGLLRGARSRMRRGLLY